MAIIGQLTVDQIQILEVDTDPTVSGVTAAIGSMAMLYDNTNSKLWMKTGSGDTNWTAQPKIVPGTVLQNNAILLSDSTGQLTSNTTALSWDPVNFRISLGAGAAVPVNTLHLDRGTGLGAGIKFTAGTTTGQTSGDGFSVGIDGAANAYLTQYENQQLIFQVNSLRSMTLTPAGQVLIGAATAAIDITGTGVTPFFQIIGTSTVQMVQAQYSADTIAPVFNSIKSRGVTIGTQGLVLQDDELGRFQFRGSDGVNFQAGAAIRALVDGTAAANSMPGRLIFMTTPLAGVTPVERMRISQNGHVKVVDSLQSFRMIQDVASTATANTTTTMTTASAGVQIYTGTTAGQILKLPDATTLLVGAKYEIYNNSTKDMAIQDNAGTALETCFAGTGSVIARLISNGTAAGTWVTRARFEPFFTEVNSTAGMSINSVTDVLITGMSITPAAGTYRVTFDSNVSIATNTSTIGFAIYVAGTINANSQRDYVASAANARVAVTSTGTVTVDGTQAIEIRGKRSSGTSTVNTRTLQITRVG